MTRNEQAIVDAIFSEFDGARKFNMQAVAKALIAKCAPEEIDALILELENSDTEKPNE